MPTNVFTGQQKLTIQQQIDQARNFLATGMRPQAATPPAAEAPPAAPAADTATPVADDAVKAAATATEVVPEATLTGVAGSDPEALARAARAVAEQAAADPAYTGVTRQVVDVQVQPRVIMQPQAGPVVVPVDIPIPAAETKVTVQPPTAVTVEAPPAAAEAPVAAEAATVADDAAKVVEAAPVEAMPAAAEDALTSKLGTFADDVQRAVEALRAVSPRG